jgi:curved DNA-binding protein CbpA
MTTSVRPDPLDGWVDYVALLGIDHDGVRSIDGDEVRRAYRRAAREHHPDVGGDPEMFTLVAEAQQVLSDARQQKLFLAERHLRLAWTGTPPTPAALVGVYATVERLLNRRTSNATAT